MVKEYFKNYVLPKKKIVDMYLKIGDFCPVSMASSALTGTWMNKDPFKTKDSAAHYLLYALLMTYQSVLGAE